MFSGEYSKIFKNGFSYRTTLVAASGIEAFFSLLYITYKIVWHKYNLMISFSVDAGHPGKYSYEIPHEDLWGWGNLLEKVKRNRLSNLVSIFQIAISVLACVATFSGTDLKYWLTVKFLQTFFTEDCPMKIKVCQTQNNWFAF